MDLSKLPPRCRAKIYSVVQVEMWTIMDDLQYWDEAHSEPGEARAEMDAWVAAEQELLKELQAIK